LFERGAPAAADVSGAADRIGRLEADVAALRQTVERLCAELGVAPPPQADSDA
jgi:hypothetical protein